jgi:2-polyprenyl-6-hydroxyphenyl methylase/3-demethylubiquinone-9 3-methyltransferase
VVAEEFVEFGYRDATPAHTAAYLLGPVMELAAPVRTGMRVLDVGCGNGYMAGQFLARGCSVVGVDVSREGIAVARQTYPGGRFEELEATSDLRERLGEEPFDLVLSTEVVEHVYSPRPYARCCFNALRPGGRFVCSTPYHGYLKNLALAVSGKFDPHFSPLWDGGHIKFWSRQSLGDLLTEIGFQSIGFRGAGRIPYLWMSMVMCGDKPGGTYA